MLAVTRLHQLVGDEALRATVLALEALRRDGVENPEDHVVVVLGRDLFNALFGTVLVRNEPFTENELAEIRLLADERGEGVAFAPGGPYQLEWADLAAAESPTEFCHSYRLDVCPPTDDRPFFFNMKRLRDLGDQMDGYSYAVDPVLILFLAFAVIVVLATLGYVVPLLLARHVARPPPSALAYFVFIGLGFLLVEAVFIQRFVLMLGYPTYSLSVVLASLLAFTGFGSWLSARWPDAAPWVGHLPSHGDGAHRGVCVRLARARRGVDRGAVQCSRLRDGRGDRAVRHHDGDGDAHRAAPLRGTPSRWRAVRMGGQRVRLGRGRRAGHRPGVALRVHRDHAGRCPLLRSSPRARRMGTLGEHDRRVAWNPEGWQSGRMQWS